MIVWNDSLRLGVEEIDKQHEELFERVNGFISACEQGAKAPVVIRLMQYMQSYVRDHFEQEEALQQRVGYTAFEEHSGFHDEFRARLEVLAEKVTTGEDEDVIRHANEMATLCENWLVGHVMNEDQQIAAFLKQSI